MTNNTTGKHYQIPNVITPKRKWVEIDQDVTSIASDLGLGLMNINSALNIRRYKVDESGLRLELTSEPRVKRKSSSSQAICDSNAPKRTKPRAIKKPKTVKTNSKEAPPASEDGEECLMCHEGYNNIKDKSFLPCAHYFHKDCVDQWLVGHTSCPVCRLDIS